MGYPQPGAWRIVGGGSDEGPKKQTEGRHRAVGNWLENSPVFEYDKVKDKGWVGEPKGLLQALWERGLLDDQKDATNITQ